MTSAVSGDAREDRLSFRVPAGCAGQWIEIGVAVGSDAAASPPLVRAVRLVAVDRPAPVPRDS